MMTRNGMGSVAVLFALASVASGALGACQSKPSPANGSAEAGATEPPKSSEEERGEGDARAEEPFVEAGNRFRDAAPGVVVDALGPIDAACSGAELSLAAAVVDKRCAIESSRAKQLRAALERDGGPPVTLRQEAKVASDGRIALRLVNTGASALVLPLSYSAKLPAFSVLAEDDKHSVFELESPRLEVAAEKADRPRFARIVLAPGAAAVASFTVSPVVSRVLGRGRGVAADKCPDGGTCAPSRLAKGHYTLHVGELLTDVEAGPPAPVTFDLP